MSHSYRFDTPHAGLVVALCTAVALLFVACGGTQQILPPGQNSGSSQNAPGTFNLDTAYMAKAGVGQTVNVYDAFTTVTTSITVSGATTSTNPADQNAGAIHLPDGEQFLIVNLTLTNTSASATSCPNPKVESSNTCTEYLSPLANFRLFDDQQRQWPTTTGAAEQCSDPSKAARDDINCANRNWIDMLQPGDRGIPGKGLQPGNSFSSALFFVVPADVHSFDLYFAPYRFPEVESQTTPTVSATTTVTPTTTAKATVTPATATPTATAASQVLDTVADISLSV